MLNSITKIDLKGIVLAPGEGTSLSGANRRKGELARVLCGQAKLACAMTLFLLEEGKKTWPKVLNGNLFVRRYLAPTRSRPFG
jgi:hypothetical protein